LDDSKVTAAGSRDEESIHRLKRNIVAKINSLVIKFNQLIKEGANKQGKSDQSMNDMI
jgi:hypothetical protein